jgi:signal transduction histidine kinase
MTLARIDLFEKRRLSLDSDPLIGAASYTRATPLGIIRQFSQDVLDSGNLSAMLHRALAHAMALIPAASCGAIYLADAADEQLVLHASHGFSTGPAGTLPLAGAGSRILCSHHWYIAHSTDELTLLLALDIDAHRILCDAFGLPHLPSGIAIIPLLAQDRMLGMLFLMRLRGVGPFITTVDDGLVSLTNMAAAAVQRAEAPPFQFAPATMLHTERMAAVGQLTAAMTHEINNPLSAVQNALALMQTLPPDHPRSAQLLQIAREELARVTAITTRMRDVYRPQHQDLGVCDLHHLLEDMLALAELQIRGTSIRVMFIPSAEPPLIRGNDSLLRQVFLNLILNAIDAMPDGGVLTVRVSHNAATLLIDVQDTGVGIPAAIRPRLFEPFVTSKPTGTGLGLAISAQIMAQHGGRIDVTSHEGTGSTFRVVLPYQPFA